MTTAAAAAAARINGGETNAAFVDPLDKDGDDPAVLSEQLAEYKKTLEVKEDNALGVEENEQNFQETMDRFCEYLAPEYEAALKREAERNARGGGKLAAYDEDQLSERKWIPADEFGAAGDFRGVALSYSFEREALTSKVGVPGHPAPALERWRERKTVEARALDWTEAGKTLEEVLAAEYATHEEEEEEIAKVLAVRYQKIEALKQGVVGGNGGGDDEGGGSGGAYPSSQDAVTGLERDLAATAVGGPYAYWDLQAGHHFPRATQYVPLNVEGGDSVVPLNPGDDSLAWQRARRRRRDLGKDVLAELANAAVEKPEHAYVALLKRERVLAAHAYAQAVLSARHSPKEGVALGAAHLAAARVAQAAAARGAHKGGRRTELLPEEEEDEGGGGGGDEGGAAAAAASSLPSLASPGKAAGSKGKGKAAAAAAAGAKTPPKKKGGGGGGSSPSKSSKGKRDTSNPLHASLVAREAEAAERARLDKHRRREEREQKARRRAEKAARAAARDEREAREAKAARAAAVAAEAAALNRKWRFLPPLLRPVPSVKAALAAHAAEEARGDAVLKAEAAAEQRTGIKTAPTTPPPARGGEGGGRRRGDDKDLIEWARVFRESLEPLLSARGAARAQQALDEAEEQHDTYEARAVRKAGEYKERATGEAPAFLTQDDMVACAEQGDLGTLANCLLQEDPPLDVNDCTEKAGVTPFLACFKNLLQVEKAQKDIKDSKKQSRAYAKAKTLNGELRQELERCLELLVHKGADPALAEQNPDESPGWAALHYAAHFGNTRRVRQLLRHGCEVDADDKDGRSPLMEAAKQGHLEVVDSLVMSGGSVDKRDGGGVAVLHLAGMCGRQAVATLLLVAGANKGVHDRELNTAADLAMAKGHHRTAQAIATFVAERSSLPRILTELEDADDETR